jgi:(2Fe-2S) ferredoxin
MRAGWKAGLWKLRLYGEKALIWSHPRRDPRYWIPAGSHLDIRIGEYLLPAFERHVFVCHNSRPADAPRPSCTTDGKSEVHARLNQLTKEAGLGGRVRINKSGCLDQCEHGPTVVVYPEAVWYGKVKPEDAEEIVAEHLVGGRPVERLRIADACLNAKSCPHRG